MTARSWDEVYGTKPVDQVSWYQRDPTVSLRLIGSAPGPLVDVGAGASTLVDRLLDARRTDLTVLDVSATALDATRSRLGERAGGVTFAVTDVLDWAPQRRFGVWHDRALFHFMTDPEDQRRYVSAAAAAVVAGGVVVVATFAADGPTRCSGLPTTRWSAEQLGDRFGASFVLEHSEVEVHATPAGGAQPFTWVVLRKTPAGA